jgi:Ti-type conjugative transfer relaxase TraA
MAIYHLTVKLVRRHQARPDPGDPSGARVRHGAIRSVVAAAAYRAGEALHDERIGRTHNFLAKAGVVHSEVLLPEGAPARWRDRATLWNEVERVEHRTDAQLAREIELSLPRELSEAGAIQLARDFALQAFVRRGMVADVAVHIGRAADGSAQPHAHILLTMRRVVPGPAGHPDDGRFGLKERAWNDRDLVPAWRAAWAELVNARLVEAGCDVRVDHRANAARGIALEPQNKIGPAGARRAVRGEDAERTAEHRAIARRNGERLLADPTLALVSLSQQQSTFTRQDLARLVHRHSDGAVQFAAVMAAVEASPELVRVGQDGQGRVRFSTREMVAVERRMEAAALSLSQRTAHVVDVERRRALLAASSLGSEQQIALGHVTRSRDLTVVVGYAGTGKSTLLGVARQAWEAQGYTVRGATLSGIAAEGLEAGAGITSRTIASWEHAWAGGFEMLGPRDVLVVDECGMVGSRQMERLLAGVQRAGAKLVLVGDPEQLQAIEAGAAFRAIVERVGAAEITEVRRQRIEWQRAATQELATGHTKTALRRYSDAGMVHQHATDAAARAALIADWQAARERAPEDSRIIIAHRREDVRALNQEARVMRCAAGELGVDRLLPTELGTRIFAVGDRIFFLRNNRDLGVKNGTLGTLIGLSGQGAAAQLTVRLDRAEPTSGDAVVVTFGIGAYAHIDHGYAATAHKAQGVTVDWTHVLATPGLDRHWAYVGLSRHRDGVALHWSTESFGSPTEMMSRLARERAKDTSLDYGEDEVELCTAYAERRGLSALAPASEIVVREAPRPVADHASRLAALQAQAVAAPGLGQSHLLLGSLEAALRPALEGLLRTMAQQAATARAVSAALEQFGKRVVGSLSAAHAQRAASAEAVRPPAASMFAGLRLSAAPLPAVAAAPEPTALERAVVALLAAVRAAGRMLAAKLPLAAHQSAALASAYAAVNALRPGFTGDLDRAIERQPGLWPQGEPGGAELAALIAAGEAARAEREATERYRQEHAALAPVRTRLLEERMDAWWRAANPRGPHERPAALPIKARFAKANMQEAIEKMSVAELRQIAAGWAAAVVKPAPGPAPEPAAERAPRPRPSPGPSW